MFYQFQWCWALRPSFTNPGGFAPATPRGGESPRSGGAVPRWAKQLSLPGAGQAVPRMATVRGLNGEMDMRCLEPRGWRILEHCARPKKVIVLFQSRVVEPTSPEADRRIQGVSRCKLTHLQQSWGTTEKFQVEGLVTYGLVVVYLDLPTMQQLFAFLV